MIWKRARFTSFTNSAVVALSLAGAAGFGTSRLRRLRQRPDRTAEAVRAAQYDRRSIGKPVGANRAAPEREIAANSNETIPSIVHNILVDPLNAERLSGRSSFISATSTTRSRRRSSLCRATSERFVCWRRRPPCSCRTTSHTITRPSTTSTTKQIVTLADPWAQVSFLLTGRNLIGAKAHARLGDAGESLLELTFKDFARALHGLANAGALLPPTIDVVEKLYPERAGDESFLFWRYSRPLTGGMDATLMTMLDLGGRDDLKSKPRLALLSDYTNDLAIGVLSNFANDASAGKDAGRTNFFRRLGNYATGLPWSLKWTLVQRSKLAADYPLQLAIVEGFRNRRRPTLICKSNARTCSETASARRCPYAKPSLSLPMGTRCRRLDRHQAGGEGHRRLLRAQLRTRPGRIVRLALCTSDIDRRASGSCDRSESACRKQAHRA